MIAIFFIIIAIKILWRDNYIALLKEISFFDLLIAVILTFLLIVSSSYTLQYLIFKQYKIKISTIDTATLPLMMNFWGYIIPFRGGILYSILFLKAKYKVKLVDSTAINVYVQMVMFAFMGFLGLVYLAAHQRIISVLGACSVMLVLNPLIVKLVNVMFQRFSAQPTSVVGKIQHLTNIVIDNSNSSFTDVRATSVVVIILLARFFLRAVRYYWATLVFKIEIPFLSLIVLTLAIEFAMVTLRFSPGNLGINELLSGAIVGMLGQASQEGILIELFCRFANLLLIFTAGLWAVLVNMKYFDVNTFKSLWSKVKAS